MKKTKSREIVLSGLFIALGLLVPMAFHAIGGTGPVFLPMHLPVLIGGFILSPVYALMVGILTPLLSSVLTGMPVLMPMAFIMMVELGIYGLAVSLLKEKGINNIITLITAMILGRISAGMMVAILVSFVGVRFAPPVTFLIGAVTTGIPGILIQLIFIPILISAVKKAVPNLISEKNK
ncbi:MAG: ECF transporter S component [Eubacteriales bacterium]|nr:ECF transporter S component [Eubacteriales bacterium]